MGFIKIVVVVLCILSIMSLIYAVLWLLKPSSLPEPKSAFLLSGDTLVSLVGVFIMVAAILITIYYSSGQISLIKEQMKAGDEQIRLLENQVFVSNSLSISQIADRCLWYSPNGGDYDSYLLLKTMKTDPTNKKLEKVIDNQIKRIEDRYRSIDVMKDNAGSLVAIMVDDGSRRWADIKTVSVGNIFEHMKRFLPTEQIKAAYFMGGATPERLQKSGKTWEDVFNALVDAMNDDKWCLWGRKMALISYSELSGTQFSEVFAFEEARQDWQNRKQEILKKMKSL